MSSIGKILVVVNLVLSLLLVGSLGALLNARTTTLADNQALQQQLDDKEAELAQVLSDRETALRQANTEKTQLDFEKQDLEVTNSNLERTVAKLQQDNQQIRDDVTKLTANYDLLQSDLSASMQRNSDLQDAADQTRGEAMDAKEAQRQAELARRDLEDQIGGYEGRIAALESDLTDALERARDSEMLGDVAVASGFDPTAVMAMPAIDAVVAQVDNELGFVILDKGATDLVKKGFTFDVYNGGTYKGRVRVDQVHDQYSTASIVVYGSDAISRLDTATTRL